MTKRQHSVFKLPDLASEKDEQKLYLSLQSLKGIYHSELSYNSRRLEVDFDPFVLSVHALEAALEDLGYPVKKGRVRKWLEKMAESNEKQFGHGHMDCCKIKKN